jgi:hypothetical protein
MRSTSVNDTLMQSILEGVLLSCRRSDRGEVVVCAEKS